MDFYPKKNSGPFRCEVCDVTVNSEMQLVQHRTGKMHVRKMRADIPSEETGGRGGMPFRGKNEDDDDMDPITQAVVNNALGKLPTKRKAQPVTCNACNLTFNSELQAAQHYNGSRHAKKVRLMEAAKQMETEEDPAETDTNGEKLLPSSGDDLGKKLGLFFCGYCNISVNSLQQLDAHKSGSKHRAKVQKADGKSIDDVKDADISDGKDSD